MDVCEAGGTVSVAAGTYTEAVYININQVYENLVDYRYSAILTLEC